MVRTGEVAAVFILFFLVPAAAASRGAHSLVLNFTVQSQPRPGQPWCEIQGSVDKEPFLQYDSDSNEVKPLGLLGEKVKATTAWTELPKTLRDVGQELRKILSSLDGNKTRGPATLQAEVSCRCEGEQCTAGPGKFSFNGKTAFLFDPRSMNGTLGDPGARDIKQDWEHLVENFRMLSKGDCNHWLREFVKHSEGVLEPTALPPDTQGNTSLNTSAAGFTPLTTVGITGIIGSGIIGSGIIIGSIFLVIRMCKSGRVKALCRPSTTPQGPNVGTIRDVGDEELNMVSHGSPDEFADVSGVVPEVTRIRGEPLLPESSCSFELIPLSDPGIPMLQNEHE